VKFAFFVLDFSAPYLGLSGQDVLLQLACFAVGWDLLRRKKSPGNLPPRPEAKFQIKDGPPNTASALLSTARVILPAKTFLL
jgi:hypothetical protein